MKSSRKKKIGRNDPCPCGSGKKHKHCCLEGGREPEELVRRGRRLAAGDVAGECSAPPQSKHNCSAKIVKAHTVPQASLSRIAIDGHVLSFLPNATNLESTGQPCLLSVAGFVSHLPSRAFVRNTTIRYSLHWRKSRSQARVNSAFS